jgi:hypothetical protein
MTFEGAMSVAKQAVAVESSTNRNNRSMSLAQTLSAMPCYRVPHSHIPKLALLEMGWPSWRAISDAWPR